MNERDLKSLFCSSLRANHVKNNDLIPTSEIRIVQDYLKKNKSNSKKKTKHAK